MDAAAPLKQHDLVAELAESPYPTSSQATVRRLGDEPDLPLPNQRVLPRIGEKFEGFAIIAELGRGSFGRVYLAHQTAMADRLVALKVTLEFFDESQTLAQLQHTNIMPIYSTHGDCELRALCMPFFGSTTLADVCRELASSHSIPTSGQHFVSTLACRRASTQAGELPRLVNDSSSPSHFDIALPVPLPNLAPGALPNFELLSRFSFVDAIMWLGARLADGLAHAHDRGIIHRDVKPANVLLADDGRPMLLDFNLSTDCRSITPARGGTVPYMAPEQLRAYLDTQPVQLDGRADVYSLGLVLYELLAGKAAFRRYDGAKPETIRKMLDERQRGPTSLTTINEAVTPAINAIVSKCLAFDRNNRYATARALQEDLDCQLANLPLRHAAEPSTKERIAKWQRRHQRATTLGGLAAVALTVAFGLGFGLFHYWRQSNEQGIALMQRAAEAQLTAFLKTTEQLRHDLVPAPEGEFRVPALTEVRQALAQYGLPERTDWRNGPWVATLTSADEGRLRVRLGELMGLLTLAELGRADAKNNADHVQALKNLSDAQMDLFPADGRPHYWWKQREQILKLAGDESAASAAASAASNAAIASPLDRYLTALDLYRNDRFAACMAVLQPLTKSDAQHFGAWLLLGNCQYKMALEREAVDSYTMCIGLNPNSHHAWANRGWANYHLGLYQVALRDFEEARHLSDSQPDVVFQIVKCHIRLKQKEMAEAVLQPLIESDAFRLRALWARSELRFPKQPGQTKTDADCLAVITLPAHTAMDYAVRGRARLAVDDRDGALADFRQAEVLNPMMINALLSQAEVLDQMGEAMYGTAIGVLDRLVSRYSNSTAGLAGRAVLLARVGRVDEAVRDAKKCLSLSEQPRIHYQVGCVYALTLEHPNHLNEAVRLIANAIKLQRSLARELVSDPDLKKLRELPEYRELTELAAKLKPLDRERIQSQD